MNICKTIHENGDIEIEYRENNKDKILDKIAERKKCVIQCTCGKTYTHHHRAQHYKTKFHISNTQTIQ